MAWWGVDNLFDTHYDFDDLELIGDHLFVVGVPENFDDSFKRNVFAAAKTSMLGNASVDYTLKRYSKNWNFKQNEDTKQIYSALSDVKCIIVSALEYLMAIDEKPDIPSLFTSGAALARLQNTFQASNLTIKCGLQFETAALERVILEQLAWIFYIYKFEGDFFKILPTKCVNNFKTVYPNIGSLYGFLSEHAHISPETTLDYVRFDGKKLNVRLSEPQITKVMKYILIVLADMFCVVGEIIYSDLLKEYQYIQRNKDNSFMPNKFRMTKEILEKNEKVLLRGIKGEQIVPDTKFPYGFRLFDFDGE